MGFLVSIGILVLFIIVISMLFNGVVFGVHSLILNNEFVEDLVNKLNRFVSSRKHLISFSLLVLSGFGVRQVTIYYLFSGVYFWFVIFTFGLLLLLYIAPISAMFLPYVKKEYKYWSWFSKFYWNVIGSSSLLWGLLMLIDTSTKIYADESGGTFHYGNHSLKILGGLCLIIVSMYVATSLTGRKRTASQH